MCKRNSVLWNGHRVDSCMKSELIRFQNYGIKTLACCCGHGIYPETIIVQVENEYLLEINSETKIPRKTRFYKKDSNGFYYIPEISKPKEHS